MQDKYNRVQHEESKVRTKGCVDPDFIKNHKLKINTNPEEYVEIIVPLKIILMGRKTY